MPSKSFGRIERQLAIKARHVGQAAVHEQQRVAVGRRFRHRVHADDAAGAAAVVDHDGLAEAALTAASSSTRATAPTAPPAANGTISRIDFDG